MNEGHPDYLIVTNKRDITSDYIVREMLRRELKMVRLNTEDISSASFVSGANSEGSRLVVDGREVALSEIRSAYFRRPEVPSYPKTALSREALEYCIGEWEYILRSLYLELGEKWFSHPNSIILAEDKLRQLRLARQIGFNVPETIITNKKEQLSEMFRDGSVVAKPLRHSLIEDGERGRVIFTSDIDRYEDINPEQLEMAPVIFQRRIPKKCDLRVTVVGQRTFAVEINSQSKSVSQTDWRRGRSEDLDHEPVELGNQLAEYCVQIVRLLGLRFGAIDLVLDDQGNYWFLECNPNGQWAWIENRTGLPISKAIVDEMVAMNND